MLTALLLAALLVLGGCAGGDEPMDDPTPPDDPIEPGEPNEPDEPDVSDEPDASDVELPTEGEWIGDGGVELWISDGYFSIESDDDAIYGAYTVENGVLHLDDSGDIITAEYDSWDNSFYLERYNSWFFSDEGGQNQTLPQSNIPTEGEWESNEGVSMRLSGGVVTLSGGGETTEGTYRNATDTMIYLDLPGEVISAEYDSSDNSFFLDTYGAWFFEVAFSGASSGGGAFDADNAGPWSNADQSVMLRLYGNGVYFLRRDDNPSYGPYTLDGETLRMSDPWGTWEMSGAYNAVEDSWDMAELGLLSYYSGTMYDTLPQSDPLVRGGVFLSGEWSVEQSTYIFSEIGAYLHMKPDGIEAGTYTFDGATAILMSREQTQTFYYDSGDNSLSGEAGWYAFRGGMAEGIETWFTPGSYVGYTGEWRNDDGGVCNLYGDGTYTLSADGQNLSGYYEFGMLEIYMGATPDAVGDMVADLSYGVLTVPGISGSFELYSVYPQPK